MGMTVDEAIIQARIQLTIWQEGSKILLDNSPCVIETLIEIARKYQKIEEIVSNNELEWGSACARDKALLKVKKVVEDGAENNHHASNT